MAMAMAMAITTSRCLRVSRIVRLRISLSMPEKKICACDVFFILALEFEQDAATPASAWFRHTLPIIAGVTYGCSHRSTDEQIDARIFFLHRSRRMNDTKNVV